MGFNTLKHQAKERALKTRQSTLTILLTLGIGIGAMAFTTYNVSSNTHRILLHKTESLALLLDPEHINTLQADDRDETNPTYLFYKMKFEQIKNVNPEIQFVYLMRREADAIVFLLDSVEEGGVDYSPPGQVYEEATPELYRTFETGKAFTEIAGDRWGHWLTGFAPVRDETGAVIAVLGIDANYYTEFLIPILRYNAIVAGVFVMILVMMLLNRRLTKIQEKALSEKNAILHVTSHEVRTPLTRIRWACELLLDGDHQKLNPEVYEILKQTYISSIQMIERINILKLSIELSDRKKTPFNEVDLVPIYSKMIQHYTLFAKLQHVTLTHKGMFPKNMLVKGIAEWYETMGAIIFMNCLYYSTPQSEIVTEFQTHEKFIQITVQGVGSPIPQDQITKIFEGIHTDNTLTEHTEATGMGLYLVSKLSMLMGGSVRAEVSGDVTRFILEFPLSS